MAVATREWLREINLPIYILVMIFNLASWIDLGALWVEMPLLVNRLPEGWNLPSYFIVILQCSKGGIICYVILKKCLRDRLKEWPFVYFIIIQGSACMLAMGFVWDRTTLINGKEYSVALLALTSALSLVDSMSSVVFMPYMSRFKPQYMTAFFIGDGLCQIIPSLVSMIQGVGEQPVCHNATVTRLDDVTGDNVTEFLITATYPAPRFSVRSFYVMMFFVMCCSGLSFSLLHFHPYCKKHHFSDPTNKKTGDAISGHGLHTQTASEEPPLPDQAERDSRRSDDMHQASRCLTKPAAPSPSTREPRIGSVCNAELAFLFMLTAWVFCFMYGVTPSIQAYACLPYGNRAFNLSIRLGLAMNPLASLMALFVSTRSKSIISIAVTIGTICCVYQICLACLSPNPPLKSAAIGEFLVIMSSVLMMGLFNYARVCIMCIIKEKGGASALMWGGAAMHLGATAGAVVTFIVSEVVQPFHSEPACPGML